MQDCSHSGTPCFSMPQSNRPLTGSETHYTKTWMFALNNITTKDPKFANICDKSEQFSTDL